MPDNSAAIAKIENLLNTGATEAEIDGQKVKLDHTALRRRLRELQATHDDATTPRPRVAQVDLSTGF